ncbi:extracellular solute-binding protein [Martelella endophytica]|uniref:Spermidine/putrescine ABC transporter substrate-binding protein n=1 Tax=Martelella endophytica TaxID=1486262 RepID=A0A0D5LQL8_MAREN|nr:extracellular solute-binding protein [Martelella endophytica]AJY45638.1 spermidine/putrescine ABC transporter substrate-binding protein [Martelella endophytica]
MTFLIPTRRSTLKLMASGAGLLAAPSIIRPARAADSVLNITTYDKFLPQDFIDQFQRDTGIEIRIRLTDDQGKQYNLLAAEGADPTTDIVTVAGHRISQFLASDLLQPLDTDKIANWGNLAKPYQGAPQLTTDGKVYGVPLLAGFEGMVRNTDYTKASDSWELMFDPEYKGMTTYIISDFLSITMKYLGYDGDYVEYVGKPEEAQAATNAARDFLIEHKDMVRKYYDGASEVQQMLVNEDVYVAQSWSGAASKLIMDGFPVELSIPKEGTYGFLYSFNLVKNAPNPEAAYKFFGALLANPDVGAAMVRQSGFASAFAGVDALLSDRERAAIALPEEQIARIQFFAEVNRDMKNEMIDKAVAEIKAA